VKNAAHAKHQEDDAQLRQLLNGINIAHKARGKGADQNTSKKVSNDCRQPYAARKDSPENAATRAMVILINMGTSCMTLSFLESSHPFLPIIAGKKAFWIIP
jgi:hypothetical protein